MSAPFSDLSALIPIAVLSASLMGSAHCVGMCGGLAMIVGRTRREMAWYHFGRLLGYLTLGVLAGALGAATLGATTLSWLSWAASLLLALAFIQMGIGLWRGKGTHLFALPQGWIRTLHALARGNALAVGTFSALIPCGWLHGFVLGAVATQNPLRGGAVLALFWLGTIPALSAAPWLLNRWILPVARRMPRAAAVLLIAAGLLSVGVRAQPLLKNRVHFDAQEHPANPPESPRSQKCH